MQTLSVGDTTPAICKKVCSMSQTQTAHSRRSHLAARGGHGWTIKQWFQHWVFNFETLAAIHPLSAKKLNISKSFVKFISNNFRDWLCFVSILSKPFSTRNWFEKQPSVQTYDLQTHTLEAFVRFVQNHNNTISSSSSSSSNRVYVKYVHNKCTEKKLLPGLVLFAGRLLIPRCSLKRNGNVDPMSYPEVFLWSFSSFSLPSWAACVWASNN